MAEALDDRALYALSDQYLHLEQMLGDPDIPEEAIQQALEDIEGAFEEKARRCGLMYRNWSAAEGAVKEEVDRLAKRRKTFQNRMTWMKHYLANQMAKLGIKKIDDPVIPISRRSGSLSVVVDNVDDLPDELVEPRTEFVPKKNDISALLKAIDEHNAILADDKLSDEAKEVRILGLLVTQPEWSHVHIQSGELKGAHLQRGRDYAVIG